LVHIVLRDYQQIRLIAFQRAPSGPAPSNERTLLNYLGGDVFNWCDSNKVTHAELAQRDTG